MKKLFFAIAAIITAIIVTGCGITSLNTANSYGTQTNVELSRNNFKVIKHVEGFSSASYFFGIGGLSRKATRDNAVADMFSNARLKGQQTIANIYVKSHISSVLGIYTRISYSASGEVIEFLPEDHDAQLSDYNPWQKQSVEPQAAAPKTPVYRENGVYAIGDIYDDGHKKGVVFEISDGGKHGKIMYEQSLGREQWSYNETFVGATDPNDGENNMTMIKNGNRDWKSNYPAFALCAKLGEGWYLPAIEELKNMLEVRNMYEEKFLNVWSSTETADNSASTSQFANVNKQNYNAIIPVAKF